MVFTSEAVFQPCCSLEHAFDKSLSESIFTVGSETPISSSRPTKFSDLEEIIGGIISTLAELTNFLGQGLIEVKAENYPLAF